MEYAFRPFRLRRRGLIVSIPRPKIQKAPQSASVPPRKRLAQAYCHWPMFFAKGNSMNLAFRIISLIIIPLSLSACGPAGPPDEIVFSHILSDRSEWHLGAARWKELVEERLPEGPSIRIVTNASLSNNNQRAELDMVQAGTLGGSWESSILLSTVDPKWTVWSMPWLFESYGEAEAICESDLGREMLRSLEDKGIVGLAYGFNGFRRLTNSRRPVNTLEDMEGLKLRVPSLRMYISLFGLWGADPSQMNFGDLIVALREGAMDGQENPLHVIRSAGLYDMQRYLTMWEYSFDPLVLCVSKAVWDRFDPVTQKVLRECAEAAASEQRKAVVDNEAEHLRFLTDNGMEADEPAPDEIARFVEASKPLYAEYRDEDKIGGDWLTRFMEAAAP